ncbi:hypothetical protein MPSEU_000537000 [Mayamaea pseudoterrestris]|nr:hypothetical protein MPSEU_000537000 [Mayamaea pseudoterrestris]
MAKDLFSMAIATIFARECMEAMIIIGEFRTGIILSENKHDEATKKQLLRAVTTSALAAAFVAIVVVAIVAIPLAVLSTEINDAIIELIEGVSKIVAAFCVVQLSMKMPKWLGFYKSKKAGKVQSGLDLTPATIRFNVAWNIWRETAECGIFLLPAFLTGQNLKQIPISAIIGIVVGCAAGFGIYMANRTMKNKLYLCIFTTLVVIFLSVGLIVGGCHEFEEVLGETPDVWQVKNAFWDDGRLPMVLLKPFGYSSPRTVLQICIFWLWLLLCAALHYFKYWQTAKINAGLASGELEHENVDDAKVLDEETNDDDVEKALDEGNDGQEKAVSDDDEDRAP